MSLTETLGLLASARQYVRDGEEIMFRQRKLIDSLEGFGWDLDADTLLLKQLEEMQSQYVIHRDRLERQLLRLLSQKEDFDESDEHI